MVMPVSNTTADDFCYLTTTGRRTGQPHRIEIWYAAEGNTLYLLSGGRHSSDWVQNLLADPAVLVEIDGDERPARGRLLESGEEAERARSLVFAKYAPRYQGDLTDWRKRALPIAIDLAPYRTFDPQQPERFTHKGCGQSAPAPMPHRSTDDSRFPDGQTLGH